MVNPPAPALDILAPGESLNLLDAKVSANFQYYININIDGNLQIMDNAQTYLWGTNPITGDKLTLGLDGVLSLTENGVEVWKQTSTPGAYGQIGNDGIFSLKTDTQTYWSTNIDPAGGI